MYDFTRGRLLSVSILLEIRASSADCLMWAFFNQKESFCKLASGAIWMRLSKNLGGKSMPNRMFLHDKTLVATMPAAWSDSSPISIITRALVQKYAPVSVGMYSCENLSFSM